RKEAIRSSDEGGDCGIGKVRYSPHSTKSNRISNGLDVDALPVSDNSKEPEEATPEEDINGIRDSGRYSESKPAEEPSSEQSLPSFQQVPTSLMNSGSSSCPKNGFL